MSAYAYIITLGNNSVNWNLLLFRHISKHWEYNKTAKEASTTVDKAYGNSISANKIECKINKNFYYYMHYFYPIL